MGKPNKDDEEEEGSYLKQAGQFVMDYVIDMIIPVAILFYAAPGKSVDFIVDNLQEKLDMVTGINFSDVWEAIVNVYTEMLPMLSAELEVLKTVLSQPWASYFNVVYSWVEILPWYVYAVSGVVLLLAFIFVPWRTIAEQIGKTVWRTVFLFIGMMPVDDGFSLLSDKDAGNYRIFIVVAAALLTLITNYLLWLLFWASLRFFSRGIWSMVWNKGKGGLKKSKSQTISVAAEGSESKKDI